MRPPVMMASNSVVISKVANGWQVRMPEKYPDRNEGSALGDGLVESLKGLMPIFREIMKVQHEDPLLAELQGQGDDLEDAPDPDPAPAEKIGRDQEVYVFEFFSDVLHFLTDEFRNEV